MEKTFNILLMHVHGRRPAVAMHCERVIAQETINLRQFITFLAQPGERGNFGHKRDDTVAQGCGMQ